MIKQKVSRQIQFNFSDFYNFPDETKVFKDCVIAAVGFAKGHYTEDGLPIYYDQLSIKAIADSINQDPESVKISRDHEQGLGSKFGRVTGPVRIQGGSVVGDIGIDGIAYSPAFDDIGSFIEYYASRDDSMLALSTELELNFDIQEGKAIARNIDCSAISFVEEGSLTSNLRYKAQNWNKLINNVKDLQMADKKPIDELNPTAPQGVPPAVPESKKPEISNDAVPAVPEVPAEDDAEVDSEVLSSIAELKAMIQSLLEYNAKNSEVKAPEPVSPVVAQNSAKQQIKTIIAKVDESGLELNAKGDDFDPSKEGDLAYYRKNREKFLNWRRSKNK
jgi:hypothetical protein